MSDLLLAVDPKDGDKSHAEGEHCDDEGAHHGEDIPKHILDAEEDGTNSVEQRRTENQLGLVIHINKAISAIPGMHLKVEDELEEGHARRHTEQVGADVEGAVISHTDHSPAK